MPKVQTITTNFTAGVFDPRLRGRVDLEKFNSSLRDGSNVVVLKQGGITARPSSDYLGTLSSTARLVPFVYDNDTSYVLEFNSATMRVWKNGELVESSPGVPYTVISPYTTDQAQEFDYAQAGDTMFIAHPDKLLIRLRRYADTAWTFEVPTSIYPFAEIGSRQADDLTLSAATVGSGRTVTAGAAFFREADVGRVLTYRGGVATITGFTSDTQVTADISAAFTGTTLPGNGWTLEGSPLTTLTPSAKDPVGASITCTAGARAFRSADVDSFISVNGGLVRITSVTDTVATGTIEQELSSTTAAPSDAWVIKDAVWNTLDGYPATVNLYEQRLWAGNTARWPNSYWGSRSGVYTDWTPGPNDDDAVYKTIDSRQSNRIRWLVSGSRNMVALTDGDEIEIRGGVEKAITQTNASNKKQSRWGCATVKPEEAGENIIFVQRGRRVLRSVYALDVEGFGAKDISAFSESLLAAGVAGMTFQQRPNSVLWCWLDDGSQVAVTYNVEQNVIALAPGGTDGDVVSMCTVPEGDDDVTYQVVSRTINGGTQFHMERFNWDVNPGMDARTQGTGGPTTWGGFSHLRGKTVTVLADSIAVGTEVVSAAGEITIDSAAEVFAGLPYTPSITLHDPELGTGSGTAQGQSISTHKVVVRFHETVGCSVKAGDGTDANVTVPQAILFEEFGDDPLDGEIPAFSGDKDISEYGWTTDGTAPLTIYQPQPYPWTVLAVIRHITVNAG